MGEFGADELPILVAFGREVAADHRSLDCATQVAVVAAVTESALLGECADVRERLIDTFLSNE
jgi:hypothetical protein